jgi:hypothetical protein
VANTRRRRHPHNSCYPLIGAGGQLVLPGTITFQPTSYRFSALLERAKQLAQLSGQMEAAMLSAIERSEAEAYNLLKARQDLHLTRAGVQLQDLRIREAQDGVKIADLQQQRAQIQVNHFDKLLNEDLSALELASLVLMGVSVDLQLVAATLSFGAASLTFDPSNSLSSAAQGVSSLAGAVSTTASILSTFASYERRKQDWQFQLTLSQQDLRIGAEQAKLAEDHVRVTGQERLIAAMQAENAEATLDFLTNKFTNRELYEWMSDTLERVYAYFLQQATAMAKLAENQLAFERQQTPPSFIQSDYWDAPTDGEPASADGRVPDRRGLTGSARLLQAISELDQYAFETNTRKLQLTKTFSLARLDPIEFQRLRETGVMTFATPMDVFDGDFPGHYLRLIRRVRTSVIALIPASEGIRAELSTTGLSRVVIGADSF